MNKIASAFSAAVLLAPFTLTVEGASATTPDPVLPNGCAPNAHTVVKQSGAAFYKAIGTAVGKYNAGSTTSTLTVTLTQSTQRSTTWEGSASASVSWGIGQVEANFSYHVTTTTQTGIQVTDNISVPAKRYGYAQPKAEFRTFHIYDQETRSDCTVYTSKDYGYLDAITAVPFFSECVATSACTPTP